MGAIAEDVRRSGTLAAVNDAVSLNQPGTAVIAINLVVTGSNTTVFEASVDEGASPTWVAVKAINVNSGSLVASATASGLFKVDNAGYRQFRVRCSIFASGSIVVVMNGSVSPSAPGLISAAAGGAGASTIADGADFAEGSTTDVAVTGDNAGTNSAKLRGLNKLFADVWDSTNHWLQVKLMAGAAIIGAVTQSGTWTVQPGNTANTTAWKVDGSAVTQPISAVSLPLPTGAAADATIGTTNTQVGGLTEAAPASDTASSGLNGRLQRVAQRITSLTALLPTALVSNRLDVNLGAAPAFVSAGGGAPAAPTCVFTRGANVTAYTIGDEVGTSGTAPTTVSVARANGGSGIILGAQAVYSNYPATVPSLLLLVFSATVTLAGDNAQLALSDADAAKLVAIIPLTATQALNYSAGAAVSSGALFLAGAPSRPAPHFVTGGSEQTLYCCLITLNAFTPIANSETITVYLDVEQN